MVSSNASALGVIFANTYDNLVPELVAERTMASIPFGGRYRMIDFVLSSMANSGIDNVSIIVRRNYHSLMDHLGAGREWDLTRKRGGLNVFPPYAERSVKVYSGRVDALDSILSWISSQKEKYVVLSDACIAFNLDFNKLIEEHVPAAQMSPWFTTVLRSPRVPAMTTTPSRSRMVVSPSCSPMITAPVHRTWR